MSLVASNMAGLLRSFSVTVQPFSALDISCVSGTKYPPRVIHTSFVSSATRAKHSTSTSSPTATASEVPEPCFTQLPSSYFQNSSTVHTSWRVFKITKSLVSVLLTRDLAGVGSKSATTALQSPCIALSIGTDNSDPALKVVGLPGGFQSERSVSIAASAKVLSLASGWMATSLNGAASASAETVLRFSAVSFLYQTFLVQKVMLRRWNS
mmetsp:Transcript_63848/g.132996  ORF Transcript_63848/g.132996 Transcript_63848/m.132996 type:complete len:210 (-) Transcript_63848:760-1389(-)